MTEIAVWLLRWTLAGAMLSTIVIAAAHLLERRGRAAGLHLYRIALIAALAAPLIALAPPVLTFSESQTAAATQRAIAQLAERSEGRQTPAPVAQPRSAERPGDIAPNLLAIVLIGAWSAGAALGALRRQRSAAHLSRAFASGAPYPTSFIQCRLSADAPAPLIFGLLHPRMLAPADFAEWSAQERDAVLRHEAAHLQRGDLMWAALGDVVSALYWWMPPVTALTRQHILVTEEACDSASLAGNEDRHFYARTLLAITRRVGQHAAPGLAATGPSLRRRIERLIAPHPNGAALTAPVAALAALACALLALSGPAAAQIGRIQIYIFNAAGETSDTYAFSNGDRAAAATVQRCVGRRSPNASAIVGQLQARIHSGRPDQLSPVTIVGPGSRIELGSCDPREEHNEDSLVIVVEASERQARRLIRQIPALPDEDERAMLAELGLGHRR